jgi:hypothetical protein
MPGRPPAPIDLGQLHSLGQLHCTVEETAAFFGCAKRTLLRYLDKPEYREAWEAGRQKGKAGPRRLQWPHANGSGCPPCR